MIIKKKSHFDKTINEVGKFQVVWLDNLLQDSELKEVKEYFDPLEFDNLIYDEYIMILHFLTIAHAINHIENNMKEKKSLIKILKNILNWLKRENVINVCFYVK